MKKIRCFLSQPLRIILLAIHAVAAHAITFTNDTIIRFNDTNYDGLDIVVTNCALAVDGNHSFASLQILTGGILTHSFLTNSPLVSTGLNLVVLNDLQVDRGGFIDVTGRGSGAGLGTGAGNSVSTNLPYVYAAGSGGGHGGSGGSSSTAATGGRGYGSAFTPAEPGSGGGSGSSPPSTSSGPGGAGGGVIKLVIGGRLRVDGGLAANGADGPSPHSGGGAGGSIWISADTISGSGSISAVGGAGEPYDGGGGGGGRIALYWNTPPSGGDAFTASVSARGGPGSTCGGAGTLYEKRPGDAVGQLLIDNGSLQGAGTEINVGFSDLTLKGSAVAFLGTVPSTPSFRNLQIYSHSWLTGMVHVTSDAILQAGGGITANGGGYAGGQGPGHGGTASWGPSSYSGGGGGFGGYGGAGLTNATAGPAYGSITQPFDRGSGGGSGAAPGLSNSGGAGGGLTGLTVDGTLVLDGAISADGNPGTGSGGGGGSGGTVQLSAGTLAGSGMISADGGPGALLYGGGGGGGRISVRSATNFFTGRISAFGGSGFHAGGAGTILLSISNNSISQLALNNGGLSGGGTPIANSGVVDLVVGGGAVGFAPSAPNGLGPFNSLLVHSNGWLMCPTQSTVALTWRVNNDAVIQAGGGIVLDGVGWPAGQGPGAPRSSPYAGGGGGFGGYGGSSAYTNAGGNAYGSLASSGYVGSGGGRGFEIPSISGGAGGGGLELVIRGTLTLDGIISANGKSGSGPGTGGGSGGSIILTAGMLAGTGIIAANGGFGDLPFGGGGGGGRIAVSCNTNLFRGITTAWGGAGAVYGGAGTVFISTRGDLAPQVIADNGGSRGTNTLLSTAALPFCDLTIRGGAVVNPGSSVSAISVHRLLIASNSWLTTLTPQQIPSLLLMLSGVSTIEQGGGINLDSKGYTTGPGPGAYNSAPVFGFTGGGGGHGGLGGASIAGAQGGNAYDSLLLPAQAGSGGGSRSEQSSAGGGALKLTSTDTVILDGTISAAGADAVYDGNGGASGGSVLLIAKRIQGSGRVLANGGAGALPFGGGGGGGRIAIYYAQGQNDDSYQFAGTLMARGGPGAISGAAGTIYCAPAQGRAGRILIDNNGLPGANTPIGNVADLSGLEGAALEATGSAVVDSLASLVLSDLRVDAGAAITHPTTRTNLDLTVFGDALIGTNASLTAFGKGYNGTDAGPGAGQMLSSGSGSGGGYGGAGGASSSGTPGGAVYGSANQPTDRGSRGGLLPVLTNFCTGGGAIRLRVTGTLTIDGNVNANGSDAFFESAGGGAGGSIWVTTRNLEGSGAITANGGMGNPNEGGGGGGGRIALSCGANRFTGTVRASGGAGAAWGGDGTVVLTNLPPLEVLAQVPDDVIYRTVDSVDLTFNSPLDFSTTPPSRFLLETPLGSLTGTNLTVQKLSPTQLRLWFPAQMDLGYYAVLMGIQAADIYGATLSGPYWGSFVILAPSISGRITDTNGLPVQYVTVRPTGDLLPAVTGPDGSYSIDVPPSWTGAITPAKGVWMFVPQSRAYASLSAAMTNQNFVMASASALSLTQGRAGANMELSWFGIRGVNYSAQVSTNMTDWQPCEVPCVGTNGPMTLTVPLGTEPMKFFRFSCDY